MVVFNKTFWPLFTNFIHLSFMGLFALATQIKCKTKICIYPRIRMKPSHMNLSSWWQKVKIYLLTFLLFSETQKLWNIKSKVWNKQRNSQKQWQTWVDIKPTKIIDESGYTKYIKELNMVGDLNFPKLQIIRMSTHGCGAGAGSSRSKQPPVNGA